MPGLVHKGHPVVVRVPNQHRRHHQQGEHHRRPQDRQAQQAQTMGLQQTQTRCQGEKDGGVFAQTRQAQNQTPGQPGPGLAQCVRLHQPPGLPHQQYRAKHQQGVGQEANGQHMHQRRQGQRRHRPHASTVRRTATRSGQSARQLVDQQHGGQPQHAGQHPQQRQRRVQRHQWPLHPAHQRGMVKIAQRRVRGVQQVMRLIHRQAHDRAPDQVHQHQRAQDHAQARTARKSACPLIQSPTPHVFLPCRSLNCEITAALPHNAYTTRLKESHAHLPR